MTFDLLVACSSENDGEFGLRFSSGTRSRAGSSDQQQEQQQRRRI